MCEMKKYLPPSFFNAQEHYLIHLVEEIEICGPIHTRSMWLVERHLKALKDFVRQRSCPKGSMVEGYMVYQSMVYFSEYLPQVVGDINVPLLWDVNSTNKFEGEVLLGKGRWRKVKGIRFYCNYYLCTYIFKLDWYLNLFFFFIQVVKSGMQCIYTLQIILTG
jgi:hypothetical protein